MFGVALLTSTLLALADARIYERCELARDLLNLGIRKEHLATWVCIAYHESRFNTAARNPSSGDHGLLQISEIYWCGAGKVCGLPCSALRDEDISNDVECALRIYKEHTRLQGNGFLAWVVYPQHCKHNAKKYLANCDVSVRTDGRARVLKSKNRNFTKDFSYNVKIDELLPPYLTVGSFLRGNYEKVFEDNYNKHRRVNWFNYKLDTVDELRLPVFNQKVSERYYTTTLSTTTSTTPSPLPNIKPPSPRRIESNSFRRRKMHPIMEANFAITETTGIPTTTTKILSSTIEPIDTYRYIKNYITDEVIPESTKNSAALSLTTVTTARPSSSYIESLAPFTSRTTETTKDIYIGTSTIPTKVTQEFSTNRAITQDLLTINTDKRLTRVKETPNELFTPLEIEDKKPTPKPVLPPVSIDTTLPRSIADNKIKDLENKSHNPNSEQTLSTLSSSTATSVYESSFKHEVNRLQSTSTTSRPQSRSWSAWRTTPVYHTRPTSITSKPSTVNWRTTKSLSSGLKGRGSTNISTTSSATTAISTTPATSSKPQTTLVSTKSTQLSISDNNISTTKVLLVQPTTLKPHTNWPVYSSRSTPRPITMRPISTSTKQVVTSTEMPTPTTVRTTQSIFDLYLNPTKRPKLPTFSFPPFKSGGYSLRIFGEGTTSSTPWNLNKTEPLSEASAKNQIRRQAWQHIG